MISARELSKRYSDFYAVDNVSFDVERGEIVGLLGHNGAGKTTIMKMITGFLEPDQGTITVDGKDITDHHAEIQARIGYLPENCPVYVDMTVIDYLEYAANLRGLNANDRLEAVRNAIEQTDLAGKATQLIGTLSRGYRQRVGVAQAILSTPDVLILDEPANGLDPSQILHMRQLITDLGKNATVIISTHILQEVQAVCDRVLIVRNGQLALDSTLDEIKQGQRLLLTIDRNPEEAKNKLNHIEGVDAVDFLSKNGRQCDYALHLTSNNPNDHAETIPNIARSVIDHGFSLYSLRSETRDLETVFKEINAVDNAIEGGHTRAA